MLFLYFLDLNPYLLACFTNVVALYLLTLKPNENMLRSIHVYRIPLLNIVSSNLYLCKYIRKFDTISFFTISFFTFFACPAAADIWTKEIGRRKIQLLLSLKSDYEPAIIFGLKKEGHSRACRYLNIRWWSWVTWLKMWKVSNVRLFRLSISFSSI